MPWGSVRTITHRPGYGWLRWVIITLIGINISYLIWSYIPLILFPVWLFRQQWFLAGDTRSRAGLVIASLVMDWVMAWPWGVNLVLTSLIGWWVLSWRSRTLLGVRLLAGLALIVGLSGLSWFYLSLPWLYLGLNLVIYLSLAGWPLKRWE